MDPAAQGHFIDSRSLNNVGHHIDKHISFLNSSPRPRLDIYLYLYLGNSTNAAVAGARFGRMAIDALEAVVSSMMQCSFLEQLSRL